MILYHQEMKKAILQVLSKRLVPFVVSSPGIGKSSIAAEIAKEQKLLYIDIRLAHKEPADLSGYPTIDLDIKKAIYLPIGTWPLEGDKVPQGYNGWLINFDEFSNAVPTLQHAAYQIILDRYVGDKKLHSKCLVMAAGNTESDNSFTQPMSAAMASRLIHLELGIDLEQWLMWGASNAIDGRVLAYLQYNSQFLTTDMTKQDEIDEVTYPCPRTWEFVSKLITKVKDSELDQPYIKACIEGAIGLSTAASFFAYLKHYQDLVTYESIVKNPIEAELVDVTDIGKLWACMGMLQNKTKEVHFEKVVQYIEYMPQEFKTYLVVSLVKKFGATYLNAPYLRPWLMQIKRAIS